MLVTIIPIFGIKKTLNMVKLKKRNLILFSKLRRVSMFIIETVFGLICFFIVNILYDTYVTKRKSSIMQLSMISVVQTVIAISIYTIV